MSIFPRSYPRLPATVHLAPAVLAATLLTAGLFGCNRNDHASDGWIASAQAAPLLKNQAQDTLMMRLDQGRIKGSPTAKVWMVVVSDFQCPYCKLWHDSSFASLEHDYVETGKVRLAYLTFPLPMHQNARPAAEVALCAGVQGKFWEMHDALFETQDIWGSLRQAMPLLDSLAASHGVNVSQLQACVANKDVDQRIKADYDRGIAAGVESTPTIFIIGTGSRKLPGVEPTSNYRHAIDSTLAAVK